LSSFGLYSPLLSDALGLRGLTTSAGVSVGAEARGSFCDIAASFAVRPGFLEFCFLEFCLPAADVMISPEKGQGDIHSEAINKR
jgi:hypothetical protein